MKSIGVVLAIVCSALAACGDKAVDAGPDWDRYAFKDNEVRFRSGEESPVAEGWFLLTAECMPAVSGVGYIEVREVAESPGTPWTLEPFGGGPPAAVEHEGDTSIRFPATFIARSEYTNAWWVRLFPKHRYEFRAIAVLDSVYIPDSTHLSPRESEAAIRYYGRVSPSAISRAITFQR